MRREQLLLTDILTAADAIARFVAGLDLDAFLGDDAAQSAVAFQLAIIGEAVRQLPDDLKRRHPHVAWTKARGMRNLIAHRYFAIDWTIVWDTALLSVPDLRTQVAAILAAEFAEDA